MLRTLRDDWCPRVRAAAHQVISTLISVLGADVLGINEDDDEPLYEDSSMSIFVVHGADNSGASRKMPGAPGTRLAPDTIVVPSTLVVPLELPRELMSASTGLEMYSIE